MADIANTDLDELVDLKTVCRTLKRSRASVYRDIERGTFPEPMKIGSSSRWPLSELRARAERPRAA